MLFNRQVRIKSRDFGNIAEYAMRFFGFIAESADEYGSVMFNESGYRLENSAFSGAVRPEKDRRLAVFNCE